MKISRLLPVFLLSAAMLLGCRSEVANRQPAAWPALQPVADTSFAALIEQLSEPGGYFDTDNLISNETSYLHVMGKMREMGVTGGAYIGVGPSQNFSYITQVRPTIAFIIDIRRDNLLQHLWFKSLFHLADSRLEYLALLTGRPLPADTAGWVGRPINELVAYIDAAPTRTDLLGDVRGAVQETVQGFGVPLSESDLSAIARIHDAFIRGGLDLRFTSFGRGPRPYYPTLRQLILERDLTGAQVNYLAHEDDFQFLRSLQTRNRVIPVVGDLGGSHALGAIGTYLRDSGQTVSAFYTSNVEFYLMQQRGFGTFARTVATLPYDDRSVIIRSFFGGMYRARLPQSVPGYYSTQLLQTIESFVGDQANGGYRSYMDLMTRRALDLGN